MMVTILTVWAYFQLLSIPLLLAWMAWEGQ